MLGALVVLAIGGAVLALDGFVGEPKVSRTVIASIAVVGGGARLLQLVASLSQLGQSQIEARTDDLTGIANRRALSAALATAATDRRDAALLVVDLDRFKEINDQHGHAVGDEVLRVMAERLRTTLPADAFLGRIGGDEFAVLLLGTASRDALDVAGVVIRLCGEPVETTAGWMSLGASVGVATTVGQRRARGRPDAPRRHGDVRREAWRERHRPLRRGGRPGDAARPRAAHRAALAARPGGVGSRTGSSSRCTSSPR